MGLFFKTRCYNGGKQHKFEPRFDEVPRSGPIRVKNVWADDLRKVVYYNKYLFDICVWCGQKVERHDSE